MNVPFFNHCRYAVLVRVGTAEPVRIPAHKMAWIECSGSTFDVSIRQATDSYFQKDCSSYVFILESLYHCENVEENEILQITREKARVDVKVYFDRLFLTAKKASCRVQSYAVAGATAVKKRFQKSQRARFLFISPVETMPGLLVLLLVMGIILTFNFGWLFATVYFPCAYIVTLVLSWVIDQFCVSFLKFLCKTPSEKTEFYRCFQNEWIAAYYANPNRKAVMDEVEID